MDMIEYWHGWLIAAFIILMVELMSGTYFLLALAGGAAIASLLTWIQQPDFSIQLVYFAVGSALSYGILLTFKKDKADINDGVHHMIGQHVEVTQTIEKRGRVRYKGVVWQAESSETLEKGCFAEIVAVNGSTLSVSSIQDATENTIQKSTHKLTQGDEQ